jgi:hypothetical protein
MAGPVTKFAPETWLESATRGIQDYAFNGFDKSVHIAGFDKGHEVYDIIMEFPETDHIMKMVPLGKTVIHFEIDTIESSVLGFGDNTAKRISDPLLGVLFEQEGRRQEINFDVGIWTADRAGGSTARLRAYQVLLNLFQGAQATNALRTATDGGDGQVELLSFMGGNFATETIGDIRVFRMLNCELRVRVFSRTPTPFEIVIPDDIGIEAELVLLPDLILLD